MLLRIPDCTFGFVSGVDAPQCLQMRIVETLDAHRQTIHASLAIGRKAPRFHRAWIGLQRDFGVDVQRQQHAHIANDLRYAFPAQQAGRAAAEEHRIDLAPPDQRQCQLQIADQGCNVLFFEECRDSTLTPALSLHTRKG